VWTFACSQFYWRCSKSSVTGQQSCHFLLTILSVPVTRERRLNCGFERRFIAPSGKLCPGVLASDAPGSDVEGPRAYARANSGTAYDAQMGEHLSGRLSSTRGQIYVEIAICASMERLWALSQDPELHSRWDLRFSRIIPTNRDAGGLVSFRYEFRLPFHTIKGTGTSLGHRLRADGQATSVLKFSTADALSPIGPGSGYWRYIPTDEGVRFITGYNYRPGLGVLGKLLDGQVIRPALGWTTAISFDRLRLWAESDLDPRNSRNRWAMDAATRSAGILTALLLFRHALTGQNAVTAAALGTATAAASLMIPPHRTVPRARRCLRQAPDLRSARAPSALAALPSPAEQGVCGQSARTK
jgi:hypothetical protein